MRIPFNQVALLGNERTYVNEALNLAKLSGDGYFTQRCHAWFENRLGCLKSLLTPSCTQALEVAAQLIDIQPGDEVIMPSYTFVSTANAFVMRGAKIIFVDICPDTMNLNADLIESAVTSRTRAIVPVHYAGVGCAMDSINQIAKQHGLWVIEDAAQGVGALYNGKHLGTIGDVGTYSFHDTKNLTSGGEGGLLLLTTSELADRAAVIRDKGTNRRQFLDGLVDKYTWIQMGGSYLPSELQAAYLLGQLEAIDDINTDRRIIWELYQSAFKQLSIVEHIELQSVPSQCTHNGHMFYIKCKDRIERSRLIAHLAQNKIEATFHYVPLHSSPAGKIYGVFHGEDRYTTKESERILRLPLWYGMDEEVVMYVAHAVERFYH
jgi:dTDP-4-amino-4,6-dideoxygalactose transaminase